MSRISESKQALEKEASSAGIISFPGGDDGSGGSGGGRGDGKPQLKLPADNRLISAFAREVGEIIGKTNQLFRRDLMPVTINREKKRFDQMTGQHFRAWAEKFITFYREKVDDDGAVYRIPRSMNVDTASNVLEVHEFLFQLPEIRRLNPARQPAILPNGKIELLTPGYFAELGIYTLDGGADYDLEMTSAQAIEILRDCFKEYPLDKRSLAAQIAAMLTTFCPCLITDGSRPPCFIYTANAPRAGKSMLAKFPNIVLFGSAATRTLPRFDEARKVLDTIVISGDTYAIFDNIRGKIQGEEIEAFLAATIWEARVLGATQKFRLENNCVVFFTGNQLEQSDDMLFRALFIELLVQEADTTDRKFSRIINDAWISSNRGRICSALWALVREWDAAGRPAGESRLLGGFETWAALVPSIVAHAGFGDCLEKPHIKGTSSEADDMRLLVKHLAPTALELPGDGEEAPSPGPLESKYEFEELMEAVKELGLFESEEVRGGRRDSDLFDKDGKVTRSGRSLYGKLFIRWDRRKFMLGDRVMMFLYYGRGDSRRYCIAEQ